MVTRRCGPESPTPGNPTGKEEAGDTKEARLGIMPFGLASLAWSSTG